jgi:hypothetical protein
MWSQMAGSRGGIDILHAGIAAFAVAVAYGLWWRQEWGRVFAITLAAIVLFYSVGVKLLLPFLAPSAVQTPFDWPSLGVGALSILCIVLLTPRRFSQSDG